MNSIEHYFPDRDKIPVQEGWRDELHVMGLNISMEEISNFCKNHLSQEQKEMYKYNTFYPIRIKQCEDLSFDIILGILR